MQTLTLYELKAHCVALGVIKIDDRSPDKEPLIVCSLNKLYALLLSLGVPRND